MAIFELTYGLLDEVAGLVFSNDDELESGMFDSRGLSLTWLRRPQVTVFIEPRKKKPRPRADVSALRPGALVLNEKAKSVLGPFLGKFGQLLELECDGSVEYYYNVTHVIDCIDDEKCEKRSSGSISKEAFLKDRLPFEPAVFKDPRTATIRIYVNQGARTEIEGLVVKSGITGIAFADLGPPPRRIRP